MPDTPVFLRPANDGVLLDVHIVPGAKRSCILGVHGDRLKISLAARPVDGKANEALCTLLVEMCAVARKDVLIVRGKQSRQKTVCVTGIALNSLVKRLNSYSS